MKFQYKNIIVPLIIFFLLNLQAGSQGVFIGFHVPWHNETYLEKSPVNNNTFNKNTYYLTFSGATFPDQQTMFPHYEISLSDKNNLDGKSIRLHILKTEPLPPEALKKIQNLKQLQANFQINHNNYTQRKKQVNHFDLVPLRINPTSGEIEKLIDLVLEIVKTQEINKNITKKSLKYSNRSVLSSGKWVKLKINKNGIYKLTYENLLEMGISNPSDPRIFGRGGMLPEENNIKAPDDIQENAIWMNSGDDQEFGPGDYILFYGKGPDSWYYNESDSMFSCNPHLYSRYSYYYITSDAGTGKRITMDNEITDAPNKTITQFDDYLLYEKNIVNLIKSGKEWFEPIDSKSTHSFPFHFPNTIVSSPGKIKIRLLARSEVSSNFELTISGNSSTIDIGPVNIWSYTSDYAKANTLIFPFTGSSDNLILNLSYENNGYSEAKTWLDFIEVNNRRELKMSEAQMHFRDVNSVGPGNITLMKLKNATPNTRIWDISDMHNIKQIPYNRAGDEMEFTIITDSLREFIAFNNEVFYTPEFSQQNIVNQNLHAITQADMIIVTHTNFINQAEELARIHRDHDKLTVSVVTPEQIYNEFSSGSPDVSAIRNFMRMLYDRAIIEKDIPKYLLLFGDGSYDNLSDHEENTAYILTYQSQNSLTPTQSFVTDDFFGLLDEDEGGSSGLVDIGIGRLPVTSTKEAETMVNKIKNYLSSETFGPWRNNICFIGDDEDNNLHMRDANTLANTIDTAYPSFQIRKIFLDAFPQSTTPQGESYPEVNSAINNQVMSGSLIVNYIGHGNERGLAHERILEASDILSWKNFDKLPLFITATCEFSRFDDIEKEANGEITKKISAGELVLLNPDGGGIGLLSTTRLVYSSPNFILNQNFYKFAFGKDNEQKPLRLGDVLRLTKNISGSGINKRNFTLLGDPALTLGYPKQFVVTDSLNGYDINTDTDTLKALGKVTISGHLEDISGQSIESYNGIIYPSVFDKPLTVTTLGNDGDTPMTYETRENPIYKGKASINQGNFTFSFIVPKDISYGTGFGKIFYYAQSDISDASGNVTQIPVTGFAGGFINDNTGPVINLYMNDSSFRNGGITDESPVLLAYIHDQLGVNTVGNGIGHDITAYIDNDQSILMILNDYYEADMDSYMNGVVQYPFYDLEKGDHTLTLKVWDISNNSSEKSILFRVLDEEKLLFGQVRNYPNPFSDHTTFSFEHNKTGVNMEFRLQIFALSGHLVRSFVRQITPGGYRTEPIVWDGKNENGKKLSAGIYIYRIIVRSSDGTDQEESGKMIMF
ncbi:MAG: type IX secretion system sortase PorU [Bacteroidales bacterium]|nr:type IX secretion system sortase PorU [Bacteroidales bacterium]